MYKWNLFIGYLAELLDALHVLYWNSCGRNDHYRLLLFRVWYIITNQLTILLIVALVARN